MSGNDEANNPLPDRAEFSTGPTRQRSTWRAWMGALAMLLTIPLLAMVILWWAPVNRFPSEVLDALKQDSHAIFYSVDNTSSDAPSQGPPLSESPEAEFRGYRILGKVSLDSADERKSLRGALVSATFQGWDAAACFDPRHGFRVMDSNWL